jgi:hypothetical protein
MFDTASLEECALNFELFELCLACVRTRLCLEHLTFSVFRTYVAAVKKERKCGERLSCRVVVTYCTWYVRALHCLSHADRVGFPRKYACIVCSQRDSDAGA